MKNNRIENLLKIKQMYLVIIFSFFSASAIIAQTSTFYQMKIYSIGNESQEQRVDDYLKMAYLPALHKSGIEINRKVLADLAMNNPEAFKAIVDKVK